MSIRNFFENTSYFFTIVIVLIDDKQKDNLLVSSLVTIHGFFSVVWAQLSFTDHPYINLRKHKKTTISGCLRFAWQRPTLTGTRV
ncbi:hypothetical protein AB7942_25685, partial [Neobacillus sp. BF23-41]|uniref:hypothetical protein n=1 Tax=Neobacillus sp. BF23-41 TaxID=3240280 RepID=UPI0034E56F9A